MTPPVRPKKDTGALPFTAMRTSSTIWPMLISTLKNAFAPRSAAFSIGAYGYGQRVSGRMRPTLIPFSRQVLRQLGTRGEGAP